MGASSEGLVINYVDRECCRPYQQSKAAAATGHCSHPLMAPLPLPLPQGSFSWMPYLAMACIFAFILSFGIGPGELGPWGLPPLGLAEGPGVSG